jgi:hypothetical protein
MEIIKKPFIKYLFFGFINTACSYLLYASLINLGFNYLFSNIFTWVLFLLISHHVFKNIVWFHKVNNSFYRFFVISVVQIFLTSISLFFIVEKLMINVFYAPLVNVIFLFLLKFLILNKWVFKN